MTERYAVRGEYIQFMETSERDGTSFIVQARRLPDGSMLVEDIIELTAVPTPPSD